VDQATGVALRTIKTDREASSVRAEVLDFLEERARFFFRSVDGVAYDEANAVFRAGWTDLVDTRERVRALKAVRPTDNFEPIAVAFKRIRNIVEQAGGRERWIGREVDRHLLEAGAEQALADRATEISRRVAGLKQAHRYREALEQIASLRPAVDRYFDRVLVMTDDEAVRSNRLSLLAWLADEFSNIADFSEIVLTQEQRK
jgi:glycyl-tRNA synthetase beta chain